MKVCRIGNVNQEYKNYDMNKIKLLLFIVLFTGTLSFNLNAQDYSLNIKVKTTNSSEKFPSLYSNKDWDYAPVIDLISTSNMGLTLESGKNKGWSLFLQPNGAWGWNIGDGKNRLDYLPTKKQQINDGKWHEIGISFYLDKKTAWLYFDKKHVAIYSLSDLQLSEEAISLNGSISKKSSFRIKNVECEKLDQSNFYKGEKPEKFTVMSWNIWHGARHNGIDLGIQQAIDAMRTSIADIICMQETYGSGPAISDALGTLFYYRSSNLSIHSKYPIVDTYDLYESFRFGGVQVKMGEQLLDVFSLWIHYLPDVSKLYPTHSVEKILEEENKTRGKEMKKILVSLREAFLTGGKTPMIIGGDFNSSSHLDWGKNMRAFHHNYTIEWPVSKSMEDEGFIDSFREMAPVPYDNLGLTWSPRFHESLQDRIDYLYYKGSIKCVNSYVKGYADSEWPSDHAAVVGVYRFK